MNQPTQAGKPRIISASRALHLAVIPCIFVFIILALISRGIGQPTVDSAFFRPAPDTAEQLWVASSISRFHTPLIPIVHEYHPSRYSPVHSWLVGLFLVLTRQNPDQACQWPLVAICLGLISLFIWMTCARVHFFWRLMTLYILAFSPLTFEVTRHIMQECTMFMLFGLTVLAWFFTARQEAATSSRPRQALVSGLLTGFGCGALVCIRPTTFPLLICIMLHLRLQLRRGTFACVLGSIATGFGICIGLILTYMWAVNGLFHLVGYYHWAPGLGAGTFSFGQPGKIPWFAPEQLPMWRLSVESLLGMNMELTTLGGWSMLILLAGGIAALTISITRAIRHPRDSNSPPIDPFHHQVAWIGAFGLSQFLIHCFYYAFMVRFFIHAFPCLILFCTGGWDLMTRGLHPTTTGLSARKFLVFILLFIQISGVLHPGWTFAHLVSLRTKPLEGHALRIHQAWRDNAQIASLLNCPVFVDGMPVLNARLLLDLHDSHWPVAPLSKRYELFNGPHTHPGIDALCSSPKAWLQEHPPWLKDPSSCFLFDTITGRTQIQLVAGLLVKHHKFALVYPNGRDDELAPLLLALKNKGCTMADLSRNPLLRMVLVRGQPGIPVYGERRKPE